MKNLRWFLILLLIGRVNFTVLASDERLNLGLWVQERVNDDPTLTYTTFKPTLFYRTESRALEVSALIAVLLNRVETQVRIANSDFRFDTGFETAFIIAGDSPRIDGVDLSNDEFKAHRLSAFGGLEWKSDDWLARTRIRARYQMAHYSPYDFTSNPSITKPVAHITHGPEVLVEIGDSRTPFEVVDHGSRLHHHSTLLWRNEAFSWGRPGFERRIDHYYAGSIGGSFRIALNPQFETVVKTQASYISNVDRINAFSGGNLSQESLGLTLVDYKSDRATTSEIGLKADLLKNSSVVVMPLGHSAILREITPTGFRTIKGIGGGLKVTGTYQRKWIWDLTYANIYGAREDISGLHEVKLILNYSLF